MTGIRHPPARQHRKNSLASAGSVVTPAAQMTQPKVGARQCYYNHVGHSERPRGGHARKISVIRAAAIHMDRLPGDEATVVADQEKAGGGKFVHLALSP
jgi:hypothetical protein